MKSYISYIILGSILLFSRKVFSQVKIGANPSVISTNVNLEIESATNSKFVVSKDSSKVGIGTATPIWQLDVRKNTSNSELVAHFVNVSQATTAAAQVAIGAGPGVWTKIVGYDGTLGFRSYSSNKEFMSLKPHTGFIGIGTSNPIGKLHVVKDSSEIETYDDYLFDSYGTTVQGMELRKFSGKIGAPKNLSNGALIGYYGFSPRVNNNNLYATTGMLGYYTGDGINNNSELRFRTTYLDRMTINSSGAVGIGTISPNANLHIYNDIANGKKTLLTLQNGTIEYNLMLADNFNNTNWGSLAADYAGNGIKNALVFNLGGMGQYIFGDHLGPWANGDYDMGLSFARWRNIYLTNSPNVSSDIRLKSKITPIELGIDAVMKLKPKKYIKYNDFNKTSKGVEEYGFIAQELNKIIPLVVTGNENDSNPMGVKYEQIIPILTRAIQEQQLAIQEQKLIIEQLRKEVDLLKK